MQGVEAIEDQWRYLVCLKDKDLVVNWIVASMIEKRAMVKNEGSIMGTIGKWV